MIKCRIDITKILIIFLLNLIIYKAGAVDKSENLDNESANYYQNLAKQYQKKADYYKALAIEADGLNESGESYNPWTGTQFSFGGGNTTGNNNTANIQSNLIINFKPQNTDSGWNFNTIGQYDYFYSSDDGVEKNRTYLQQNGYYMFNEYNGMFGQISYLNNIPDGYYYIWNENIGYQLQIFKTKRQNLLLSVGPGMQERELVADTPSQVLPSWLTQFTYNFNLNDRITFMEQLQNIATTANTATFSISTITIQAYKNIGIGLNYQFNINSNPDFNQPSYTSISGVTLVYSID